MTQRLSMICFAIIAAAAAAPRAHAQALDFPAVDAEVDFARSLRDWDAIVYEAPAGSVTTFFGLP